MTVIEGTFGSKEESWGYGMWLGTEYLSYAGSMCAWLN